MLGLQDGHGQRPAVHAFRKQGRHRHRRRLRCDRLGRHLHAQLLRHVRVELGHDLRHVEHLLRTPAKSDSKTFVSSKRTTVVRKWASAGPCGPRGGRRSPCCRTAQQPALLMVGGVIDIELGAAFLAHPAERHRGQVLVRMVDACQQQHQRPARRSASCSAPARTPASARIAAIVPVVIRSSRVDIRGLLVRLLFRNTPTHYRYVLSSTRLKSTPSLKTPSVTTAKENTVVPGSRCPPKALSGFARVTCGSGRAHQSHTR